MQDLRTKCQLCRQVNVLLVGRLIDRLCPCRLVLLLGGFLLFFAAFFAVHAIFKVCLLQDCPCREVSPEAVPQSCPPPLLPDMCPNIACCLLECLYIAARCEAHYWTAEQPCAEGALGESAGAVPVPGLCGFLDRSHQVLAHSLHACMYALVSCQAFFEHNMSTLCPGLSASAHATY